MTKLSVNINKIASIRNARGGDTPNLCKAAIAAQNFGADGITIHPRPDERHIRYQDVPELKKVIHTEYNIEGYPSKEFMDLVIATKPDQVTLVPDGPDVITSNAGWDCKQYQLLLADCIMEFKKNNIRVSIFLDPDVSQLEAAKSCGADRIELYTESYASRYIENKEIAIEDYTRTAREAKLIGLGVNAGHDLSLVNLSYFLKNVPNVLEVSIGHALISDSLYYGLNNTIQMYKAAINPSDS